MTRQITEIQAFLASPSDVAEERKVASNVIAELNRTTAPDLGYFIRLIRWEDMVPTIEQRAQQVILDHAGIDCTDIFIGILWNRFGTPTGRADSGTKEEFDIAHKAWQQHQRPRIMFYFCQRPANFVRKDELEQKVAVLNFKENIGKRGIFREFSTAQEFESTLRQDITRHLLSQKQVSQPAAIGNTSPNGYQSSAIESRNQHSPSRRTPPEGMIKIGAGVFLAGRASLAANIPYDFFIDEVPITNANFVHFMDETGFMLRHPRPDVREVLLYIIGAAQSRPDHPVALVTWYDAQAYAAWAGKRLPTSLEWERVARGRQGFLYPWGNNFDLLRCNSKESGIGHTTPVRQYPTGRSEDGCFDLVGNVFEWVSDWAIHPRYSSAPNSEKINRGASFARTADDLICWFTESDPPDLRMRDVGFRCAWTPNEVYHAQ
ncbi:MAG: SUMF1/EgtB/PvdO family nonheme iron enzyme [Candidatus Zixiibacteriota bacterium]